MFSRKGTIMFLESDVTPTIFTIRFKEGDEYDFKARDVKAKINKGSYSFMDCNGGMVGDCVRDYFGG